MISLKKRTDSIKVTFIVYFSHISSRNCRGMNLFFDIVQLLFVLCYASIFQDMGAYKLNSSGRKPCIITSHQTESCKAIGQEFFLLMLTEPIKCWWLLWANYIVWFEIGEHIFSTTICFKCPLNWYPRLPFAKLSRLVMSKGRL